MLPAQVFHRHTRIGLSEEADDLGLNRFFIVRPFR